MTERAWWDLAVGEGEERESESEDCIFLVGERERSGFWNEE